MFIRSKSENYGINKIILKKTLLGFINGKRGSQILLLSLKRLSIICKNYCCVNNGLPKYCTDYQHFPPGSPAGYHVLLPYFYPCQMTINDLEYNSQRYHIFVLQVSLGCKFSTYSSMVSHILSYMPFKCTKISTGLENDLDCYKAEIAPYVCY